jgi:CHAT domain-containing protein
LRAQGAAPSLLKAIEKYEEALPLLRAAGDVNKEAATFNNMGEAYYLLGQQQKALEYFKLAQPLFKQTNDRGNEAGAIINIGAVYFGLGDMDKALEFFAQAVPLLESPADKGTKAYALHNLASVYNSLGENQKALEYYSQALPLWKAVNSIGGQADTLNNIAAVYSDLGEAQQAIYFYEEALALWTATHDTRNMAYALNNIGHAHNNLREYQKALNYLNRAMSLWETLGDFRGKAYTLLNTGNSYQFLGEPQKALDFYNQTEPLWKTLSDRAGEANMRRNSADAYYSLGKREQALNLYLRALATEKEVGDRNGEARELANIALIHSDLGKLVEARAEVEAALAIAEDLRTKVVSGELRASYYATVQGYYLLDLDILMQLHKLQPADGYDVRAYQVGERARARSFLDLLSESRIDIRHGVSQELLERERALRQLLGKKAELQVQLVNSKATEKQIAQTEKELRSLTADFQEVQAQIRQQSPNYASLTQPHPLSLAEVQQRVLDDDTILLQYSLGEQRSYLWVVTRITIKSFELPAAKDIQAVALHVSELLTARHGRENETEDQYRVRIAAADAEYPGAARRLSQMVLGPAAGELGTKRLVIVADGALQYIPFAALPDPSTIAMAKGLKGAESKANKALQSEQPLIVKHELVSLPSASVIATLRHELAGRATPAKAVAILADPVFGAGDPRLKGISSQSQTSSGSASLNGSDRAVSNDKSGPAAPVLRLGGVDDDHSARALRMLGRNGALERLVYSRAEAQSISAAVPGGQAFLALDFEANRRTALLPKLGQYRYVHFATHGVFNAEHPELSGLVLSLVDEKGSAQEGFLSLSEIYNLTLPVETVVLSGCETALGKDIKGEGLVGLTRGFMYAGAPRVVASLWQVKDYATANLMSRFYKKTFGPQQQRPAAAMRAVQVEMWREKKWPSPYYWAGFIVQGEWR